MDDYGGDYGDYGDEDYGKEDPFSAALNSAQFGDFDVGAFGNEQDAPGQNTTADETTVEEQRLIGHLVQPNAGLTKRDHTANQIKQALKQVGPKTVKMIMGQDASLFSQT